MLLSSHCFLFCEKLTFICRIKVQLEYVPYFTILNFSLDDWMILEAKSELTFQVTVCVGIQM